MHDYAYVGVSQGLQATDTQVYHANHHYIAPEHEFIAEKANGFVPNESAFKELQAKQFDVPDFHSLKGFIIYIHQAMMFISLVISLAKPDFNLILYFLGYYVWCIHGHEKKVNINYNVDKYPNTSNIVVASQTTIRAVNH